MGQNVQRFEDLSAWQKARTLTKEVRALTRVPPLSKDLALCDQMRRAARSIMANLAEGFDRGSRGEFHTFVIYAKGSCAELCSDLYAALDDRLISSQEFDRLLAGCDEEARILAGLRRSLDSPSRSGVRP